MKKLLAIVLAVMLAVAMLPLTAMADVSIDKELSESEASLGDHITVTLDVSVSADQAPATVEDTLPDPLKYIDDTLSVIGGTYTCETSEDEIVCTLEDVASYTITFDVQVTSTEADEFDVTNTATVTGADASSDSDSADLTIYPYEGFEKWMEEGDEEVPMYTDVYWVLGIYVENIDGDDIEDMEDIVVRDRLGGDLELDEVLYVSDGSIGSGEIGKSGKFGPTGKTNKEHLAWTGIPDMVDADWAEAYLLISTDVNPGQKNKTPPKNEYTEAGEHDLNSGAVLKFTDPDTGFQLSAHTPPITVEAFEPLG